MDIRKKSCKKEDKRDMNYQCPMMCLMCMEPMKNYPREHSCYEYDYYKHDKRYSNYDQRMEMMIPMMCPMMCTENMAPMGEMQHPMMDMMSPMEGMQYPMMDMMAPMEGMQHPMMDMMSPMEGMQHPMMDMISPMEGMQYPMMDMTSPMEEMQHPMMNMTCPMEGMQHHMMGVTSPMGMQPNKNQLKPDMLSKMMDMGSKKPSVMSEDIYEKDMVDVKIKTVDIEEIED